MVGKASLALFALALVLGLPANVLAQDKPDEPARDVDVPAGKNGTFPGYLPAGATKAKPCPLIVACHGHGDNAKNFLACLKSFADEAHVAIIAPEGTEKTDNGGFGWNGFPDRASVIETAVRGMLKTYPCLDAKRVVWLGHSAGSWVCCGDTPKLPDLCAGIILTANPTAKLEGTPGPKGPPRVCFFLGTADPNIANYPEHVKALKAANAVYAANKVTDLGHAVPDSAYLVGALGWVLEGKDTEGSEATLPKEPATPESRVCRHVLVRQKGAEGAGASVKRSEKDAQKEAEKLAALLRKDKPEARAARAAKSSEAETAKDDKGAITSDVAKASALLRWTCWTLGAGDVRIVKAADGWHVVWAEK